MKVRKIYHNFLTTIIDFGFIKKRQPFQKLPILHGDIFNTFFRENNRLIKSRLRLEIANIAIDK